MAALRLVPSDASAAPPRWYAHGLNRVVAYRIGAAVAGALPRGWRLSLAAAVARALAPRFAAERAVVRANLARIVPGIGGAALERRVDDVFRHFAMCFVDLISTNRHGAADRLFSGVAGREHLHAAMAGGRGLVILTAHLGNWELAGRLLAQYATRPTHVVVAAEVDPAVERFLRGAPAPVRFVTRSSPTAALSLVAALRRGEVVALQGDRALGTRGDVAVPFFGADAPFPLGPFLLARAAEVLAVPAFCVLGADRRYTVEIGSAIAAPRDRERSALAQWVRALEHIVRRHPEQWFNFYDVWSGAPAR